LRNLRIIEKLTILYRLYRLSRNPESYRHIEMLRRCLSQAGFVASAVARVKQNPTNAEAFRHASLYDESKLSLASLRELGKTSFGKKLAEFLEANRLSLVYFSMDENQVIDDPTFYVRRTLQTHDMWHVLLGYSANEIDEIGLQAFMFQQLHWPTAPFIIAGYLFRTLFSCPARAVSVIQAVADGWHHAGEVPDLFSLRLEAYLKEDLEVVRQKLGIKIKQ